MAGDWIKLRTNLAGDPAVKLMARELRETVYSVVGRLHALWSWADQHTDDGNLPFTVLSDIDDVVDRRGFSEKLVSVGWMEVSESGTGVLIPNWERHNGKSAKKRCLDSEAQRRKREKGSDSDRKMSENVSDKLRQEPDQRREEKSNTPIVPASGDGEERKSAVAESGIDPLLLRAKALFRMRPATALDRSQQRAWNVAAPVVASTPEEEWRVLEAYYGAEIAVRDDIRRRDLATLLNNWSGEVTRALAWASRTGFSTAENPQKKENGGPDEELWRAALAELYPDVDPATVPYGGWGDIPRDLQDDILAKIAAAEQEAA